MDRKQISIFLAAFAASFGGCLHSPDREYYEIDLKGIWLSTDTTDNCQGHGSATYIRMTQSRIEVVTRLSTTAEGQKGNYTRAKELVTMTFDAADGCYEAPCGGGTPFYHACSKPVDTLTIQRNGRLVFRDKEYYRSQD